MYLYKSKSDLAGGDWWEARQQKLFDDITDDKISSELDSIIDGLATINNTIGEANMGTIIARIYKFKNYIKTTKGNVLRKYIITYIDAVLSEHVEALDVINRAYNIAINKIPVQFKAEFSALCNRFRKIFVGYCNLTYDFMMIVGKYFETNQDFINLMKVCRSYSDIVSAYHFNPISDTSLFENMETQHFYNKDDVKNKKANEYQYIYHFGDEKLEQNKKANEIFIGDEINYLYRQVPLLKNWCGKEFDKIIYDSDKDVNKYDNGATLFAKIKNKPNLYFIIIDSNENIFGFYVNKEITREIGKYNELFMFSLRSNENEPKKFPVIPDYKHSFTIRFWKLENDIISIQAGIREGFPLSLSRYGEHNSYIGNKIDRVFKDANKFYFTGETFFFMPGGHIPFTLKRLIVIEMK
jgi:hypothetical protein